MKSSKGCQRFASLASKYTKGSKRWKGLIAKAMELWNILRLVIIHKGKRTSGSSRQRAHLMFQKSFRTLV